MGTRSLHRYAARHAISLIVLAGSAQAQDAAQSWDNLRVLRVGARIQVVDQRLRSQDGTFLRVSDEAIALQTGQNEVEVDIPEEIIPILVEQPHPDGPYGAKGLGETALIPAPPAIANAV